MAYSFSLLRQLQLGLSDSVIFTVPHNEVVLRTKPSALVAVFAFTGFLASGN
jgi:hypothetical protein